MSPKKGKKRRVNKPSPKHKSKPPQTVSFEYKVPPDYKIYATSGVVGGLNAQGEIIVNVFSERGAIPQKEVRKLRPDHTLGEKVKTAGKDSIIRHVLFGLSLTPQTARSIAKWLNAKVDQYEELVENKG